MGTGHWSQQSNWEQTRDESGALMMGAFCLWGGGADLSMGGRRRTHAPTLLGDVTRHPLTDGGIERDLFALPPRQIHPPPPLLFLFSLGLSGLLLWWRSVPSLYQVS